MLIKLCVCSQHHGRSVKLSLSFHTALHHAARGSAHDDQSFRRSGSVMPLTMQTLSHLGSERPCPGQLWKRDSRPVMIVAVSPTTVTVKRSRPVPGRPDPHSDGPSVKLVPQGVPVWPDPHSDRPVVG